MQLIKFCGKDKRDSIKKAVTFYYDNCENEMELNMFLAKCRVQSDSKTVHYYPGLKVDLKKIAEIKRKKREERKKK